MEFIPCNRRFAKQAASLLREFSETFHDSYLGFLNTKKTQLLLMVDNGSVAAVIECHTHPAFTSLTRLMVHQSYRGSGIGKQLLTNVLTQCGEHALLRAWMPNVYLDLFKEMGFMAAATLQQSAGLPFTLFERDPSREEQVDLGKQLGEIAQLHRVEEETSARLRKLRTRIQATQPGKQQPSGTPLAKTSNRKS